MAVWRLTKDLMTGLTAINSALDAVKTIRSIEKDFDASHLKLMIADLASNLADAKLALSDAQGERQSLQREIEALKKNWAFSEALVEYRGYKYRQDAEGKPQGDAFCPVCERKEGEYFHLAPVRGQVLWQCPSCKSSFHNVQAFSWG